jgi:hypothetical protein
MNSPTKIQTVSEATSSIKGVAVSTFSSLANLLNLPQLKDSFFQNIIYILIVIIILVGILVYIQMVGANSVNPLNLPPSKEVKKIEIQKVVEGYNTQRLKGIENNAKLIGNLGSISDYDYFGDDNDITRSIDSGNLYNNIYTPEYKEPYMNLYNDNESHNNN